MPMTLEVYVCRDSRLFHLETGKQIALLHATFDCRSIKKREKKQHDIWNMWILITTTIRLTTTLPESDVISTSGIRLAVSQIPPTKPLMRVVDPIVKTDMCLVNLHQVGRPLNVSIYQFFFIFIFTSLNCVSCHFSADQSGQ